MNRLLLLLCFFFSLSAAAEPAKVQETVVGKKLDVAKARKNQKVLTPKRPYSLKQLRQKQIRELENLMDEMRLR